MCSGIVHAKLNAVLALVRSDQLYGTIGALLRVVELKKSERPHALFLYRPGRQPGQLFNNPDSVSSIIGSEIREKDDRHFLDHNTNHYTYTPCGDINSNFVCMKKRNNPKYHTRNNRDNFNQSRGN